MRAMLRYVFEATARDQRRRSLLEIIFHKCEFVGEMLPLQIMQQNLYLECYEKIEEVLGNCISAGSCRRAELAPRGDHHTRLHYRHYGKLAVYARQLRY